MVTKAHAQETEKPHSSESELSSSSADGKGGVFMAPTTVKPDTVVVSETPSVSPNAAGFALFRTLAANTHLQPSDGNLVLSPANLEPILLALEAGAGGRTADQLAAILRPQGEVPAVPVSPPLLGNQADSSGSNSAAVWIERDWDVKPAYSATLTQRLGMEVRPAAFSVDAAAETAAINRWISDATRERIPQLFDPSDLKSDTRLVLASALVYDGGWVTPFDPAHTKRAPFRSGSGSKPVTTEFMSRVGDFSCAERDGIRVVALDLEGGKQRCILILPKDGGSPLAALRELEKTLTVSRYRELTHGLEDRSLDLKLPRLKLGVRSSIKAGLQILGAGDLFLPQRADLSRISDEPGLCVSVLRHQVRVELDERGARGAAATGAAIVARGWPGKPQVWTYDRPFLFAIESVGTGDVLFLGRLVSPEPAE